MHSRNVPAIFLSLCILYSCTAAITVDQATQGEPTGGLAIALRHVDPNGEAFRLRDAVLELRGPVDVTLMPGDDEDTFETVLPVGDYTLELAPGWTLGRQQGEQVEPAQASLLSDNPQPVSIALDQQARVSLIFSVHEAGPVTLGEGRLHVSLQVQVTAASQDACVAQLVISELDYNQDGPDDAEFIELHNASDCALPTSGLSLSLLNGFSSPATTYAQIDLASAGAEIPAGGYLVVGAASVLASLPSSVLAIALGSVTIQNGDPDGVAVQQLGEILDALSYGGEMPGVTETQSAPIDRGAGSLSRCAHDTDDNSRDFILTAEVTPGSSNACP